MIEFLVVIFLICLLLVACPWIIFFPVLMFIWYIINPEKFHKDTNDEFRWKPRPK